MISVDLKIKINLYQISTKETKSLDKKDSKNITKDISIVVDSNGKFDKVWQFSNYLIEKGFNIVEVSKPENFLDGNLPRLAKTSNKILLQASSKGKPMQTILTIDGTQYQAIQVTDKIYVPSIT